ncbi:MAG TPA: hypothetical protein VEY06_13735 [Flavisolibacter sp.]|jgi:hypothetical protein|nr:hypothetical protein [Flavisolibacter sp.]
MVKKLNYRTGTKAVHASTETAKAKRASSRVYTSTVEYGMIANLVLNQYQKGANVQFESLLSIPWDDRIPGLVKKYGKRTMYQLLMMVLKEFVAALPLPVYKKPTETNLSYAACDIMLSAEEDFLSLEDVILFLQRVKAGVYGKIKTLVTTHALLQMLEQYRQERHTAYQNLKIAREESMKNLGPVVRIAKEPTAINELLQQGVLIDMTQKMSG